MVTRNGTKSVRVNNNFQFTTVIKEQKQKQKMGFAPFSIALLPIIWYLFWHINNYPSWIPLIKFSITIGLIVAAITNPYRSGTVKRHGANNIAVVVLSSGQ